MHNKGFTLTELICIIALLGLIALIAVPSVNTMINDSKEKAYKEQIRTIEESARTYMAKNSLELPDQVEGENKCLSVSKLKKSGLLSDEDIKNPKYRKNSKNQEEINETFNGSVLVTFKSNKYTYKYDEGMCKVNGTVYRWTTDRLKIGDSIEGKETTTDYTNLGKNHFIKHEVVDSKITSSEACFIKDGNMHCLKPNEYETSKAKLLQIFGESACSVHDSYVSCSAAGVGAGAYSTGIVYAYDDASSCTVYADGHSRCAVNG